MYIYIYLLVNIVIKHFGVVCLDLSHQFTLFTAKTTHDIDWVSMTMMLVFGTRLVSAQCRLIFHCLLTYITVHASTRKVSELRD